MLEYNMGRKKIRFHEFSYFIRRKKNSGWAIKKNKNVMENNEHPNITTLHTYYDLVFYEWFIFILKLS